MELQTFTEAFRQNYDPTHTTALRNSLVHNLDKRFKELMKVIVVSVAKRDCFGLTKKDILFNQMSPAAEGAFAFPRSDKKISAFMEWLDQQVKAGILTVRELEQIGTSVDAYWMNLYLFDSYKRGVMRARDEMRRAGMAIPALDAGGIGVVLGMPFHLDRMGLIFTRAYGELKGITGSMESAISRILAQGIADGDGPLLLARKIVSAINGEGIGDLGLTDSLGRYMDPMRRATILARTEMIRAHHLATIQEYRNWGVLGITVKGEWKTAGDHRVCDKCASMEGRIFTLDEIEPMIPLHPQCRCIALPYIEDIQKYRTKPGGK